MVKIGLNKMTKDLYMVIASFKNVTRNNWEIVDFNLSKKEADALVSDIQWAHRHKDVDEDWIIEDNGDMIKIVKQGEEI